MCQGRYNQFCEVLLMWSEINTGFNKIVALSKQPLVERREDGMGLTQNT